MADNWRTPPEVFRPLNAEFHFDLDAAADHDGGDALCSRWLFDSLIPGFNWPGERIWLNPPYGKMLDPFVRKASEQARLGALVVALIPMRVRAAWWHECVIGQASEVRCVRKRIRFLRPDGSRPALTPSCDSAIVVWSQPFTGITMLTSFSPQEREIN